jgi:hypothetical protein
MIGYKKGTIYKLTSTMKNIKILSLVLFLFTLASCVKQKTTERSPDLEAVYALDENANIASLLNSTDKIAFGTRSITKDYSPFHYSQFFGIEISIKTKATEIPKNYLQELSSKIDSALQQELADYEQYDGIRLRLFANGEETQKLTLDINKLNR